jgi:hypothetical protein
MGRRSKLWTEIARDRELRQRQNARAARVQQQVARELAADAARGRQADDREAKAREEERIEAERRAGIAEADEQNARLEARAAAPAAVGPPARSWSTAPCERSPPPRTLSCRQGALPDQKPLSWGNAAECETAGTNDAKCKIAVEAAKTDK